MVWAVAVLVIVALTALVVVTRHTPPQTWKERGEPRGRTRAEPEGTLHIQVTRSDGTVEDHGTVPAYRSK